MSLTSLSVLNDRGRMAHPLHIEALAKVEELSHGDPDEYNRWESDPNNEWERWTEYCREHGICYYCEGPEEIHWMDLPDDTTRPFDFCPDR